MLNGPDNESPNESAATLKLAPPAGLVLTSSTSNEPVEPGTTPVRFGASMTRPSPRQGTAKPRLAVSTSAAASSDPGPMLRADAGFPPGRRSAIRIPMAFILVDHP